MPQKTPTKNKLIKLSPGIARHLESPGGHFGVDEAGRGCLAGPVCAAAVYVPHGFDFSRLKGLTDSKKTTEKARQRLELEIKACCRAGDGLLWAVGLSWPGEIDEVNILNATFRAMSRAMLCVMKMLELQKVEEERLARGVPVLPVLIDGSMIIPLPQWQAARKKVEAAPPRQFAVVKGDLLVPAISAASILAKVHRDRLMQALARRHPLYGFAGHKGYGTKEHREALALHGPSAMHRLSFGAEAEERQLRLFG